MKKTILGIIILSLAMGSGCGKTTDIPEECKETEEIDIASLPRVAPDLLIIDGKCYKNDQKDPVRFDHKKHSSEFINVEGQKIGCTECHHIYEDGKNVWKEGDPVRGCASAGCHNPLKKIDNRLKLQIAYHNNCKECHLALVKSDKKTEDESPTQCNNCMHN